MGRSDKVRFLYAGDLVQAPAPDLGPGIIIEIYEKPTLPTGRDSFTWIRILHSDGATSTWGHDQLMLLSRAKEETRTNEVIDEAR